MVLKPNAYLKSFTRKLASSRATAKLKSMQCLRCSSFSNSASMPIIIEFDNRTLLLFRNEEICKKDDFIDFFGIIMHGSAFISFETSNNKSLGIGTMIGQMNFADMANKEKHAVTVIAKTDGIIAVLPYGEVKMEVRRSPTQVSLFFLLI